MKLLLVYLFVALVMGLWSGPYPRRMKSWPLMIGAFVLGIGFLSLRVILS